MPSKRVQFDDQTWQVIKMLSHDSMKDFQELANETFRDLLKKYDRPTELKSQLEHSVAPPKRERARRKPARIDK